MECLRQRAHRLGILVCGEVRLTKPRRSGVAVASVGIVIVVLQWLGVKTVLNLRCQRPGYTLAEMFIPMLHRNSEIGRMVVLECEDGHDENEALWTQTETYNAQSFTHCTWPSSRCKGTWVNWHGPQASSIFGASSLSKPELESQVSLRLRRSTCQENSGTR